MSGVLLQPQVLPALALRQVRVTERLSLNDMPRLVEALPPEEGNAEPVACELTVAEEDGGGVLVSGSLATRWRLRCQRCLGPVEYPVDIRFRWRFRRDDENGFLLSDEPMRLADFVEDELLLELPQVPVHARTEDCDALVRRYSADPDAGASADTRRPFAGLKDLLGDGGP